METDSDKTGAEANIVHADGVRKEGKEHVSGLEGAPDSYLTDIQEHVAAKELRTAVHAASYF